MKKLVYHLFLFCVICTACTGQTKKDKKNETIVSTTHKESPGQPKIDIKVNKRFDKNGNLISYDSTYTSFYSSQKGNKQLMDSLFNKFMPVFNEQFPLMNDKYFKDLFFNDSLLINDFFHDDFFKMRFQLNESYMNKMMQQMDSVKNAFFKTESKKIKK